MLAELEVEAEPLEEEEEFPINRRRDTSFDEGIMEPQLSSDRPYMCVYAMTTAWVILPTPTGSIIFPSTSHSLGLMDAFGPKERAQGKGPARAQGKGPTSAQGNGIRGAHKVCDVGDHLGHRLPATLPYVFVMTTAQVNVLCGTLGNITIWPGVRPGVRPCVRHAVDMRSTCGRHAVDMR